MIFLLLMVVIGMIGNLLFPGALSRRFGRRLPPPAMPPAKSRAAQCPDCGRYLIGRSKCDCGKG